MYSRGEEDIGSPAEAETLPSELGPEEQRLKEDAGVMGRLYQDYGQQRARCLVLLQIQQRTASLQSRY